jgi:four helix bundle protein
MVNGKECSFSNVLENTRLRILRSQIRRSVGSLRVLDGPRRARQSLMDKSNDLRVRGFNFTVDIVRLCRSTLASDAILRRLAYQLVDSAGSVGANLEESGAGQTKPDFIAKQCIALKEATESRFWLRVIATSEPRLASATRPHIQEASELVAMLTASIKTAKSNPHRGEARRVLNDGD